MSNKVTAFTHTGSKFIINKRLAKVYLDPDDYNKLMEMIDILKSCDAAAKEVLYGENGAKINDS